MAIHHPEDIDVRPGSRLTPSTRTPSADPSVGELVGAISEDLSRLVRAEMELAKTEIKQETAKAGKAAGMLGGAGYAGHLVLLLGSLAAVFGLAHLVDIAWAALIVTAFWALVGAVLFMRGRKQLRAVRVTPERTVESLKEDAQWARNPTS
ncbi:phage holin family protein [Streptomyces finlayi]|uniref:Phage holin family protein n=1 Tax=Streptomyces finlayi TaxID=67296 RepID=A0A7G7BDS2_9ACTN|nr:phage holin family protein [Streptomyces finlayi]QNE73487.1 phage holin family protein [Streptomyces finlayi]